MKRNNSKSTEKRSHSQRTGMTPDKKKKSTSYTQGDKIAEDFEDVLMDINLKKPRSAYILYATEMMSKDKVSNFGQASKMISKKWQKLSQSDRKKYEDLSEKDKERYQHHLELVKKHLLQKPLAE
jgi:hypothetical protein